MSDILDRIDNTIDGLCPCGAEPQAGLPYCSYDCEPNWRGRHTISDVDQTPMRWRPDLVTATDDNGLTLINEFRRGQHNAQIFEHQDGRIHCRLDDGHRFVGVDTDGYQMAEPDGLNPIWERLETELGNTRYLEADPWADVFAGLAEAARGLAAGFRSFSEASARAGEFFVDTQFIASADLNDMSQASGTAESITLHFDNSNSVFNADLHAYRMSEILAARCLPPLNLSSITAM